MSKLFYILLLFVLGAAAPKRQRQQQRSTAQTTYSHHNPLQIPTLLALPQVETPPVLGVEVETQTQDVDEDNVDPLIIPQLIEFFESEGFLGNTNITNSASSGSSSSSSSHDCGCGSGWEFSNFFLPVFFLGMTSGVQTELSGAHSVLELQLQLLSSIEDQNRYANDSADAACQPDTLEELWLQMNRRGMRDEVRRN